MAGSEGMLCSSRRFWQFGEGGEMTIHITIEALVAILWGLIGLSIIWGCVAVFFRAFSND
jgi:hypothetical protein